jgi:chromosome segregation ATPase
MNIHAAPLTEAPEAAIPCAPSRNAPSRKSAAEDRVETAGQTIIQLVTKAVETADANVKRALDVAQKLSRQLQAAEQRNTDLEADLRYHKDRAERAEKWLNFIQTELQQKFFGAADGSPISKA